MLIAPLASPLQETFVMDVDDIKGTGCVTKALVKVSHEFASVIVTVNVPADNPVTFCVVAQLLHM